MTMLVETAWPLSSIIFTFTIIFITLIAILFNFNNPFQFHIKFGVYVFITIIYSILVIPFALLRPNNSKNVDLVANQLSFLFKIFQIKITIENAKYLQINQPYILINNHQSSLDFLTMMKIWPGNNCTPLAKKELLYSGPFGLAIWLCGITFIDRLNPEKARGTITKLAEKINEKNMRVWIFPEGTRSPKTELLPFKKGAFHLAIQAQVPIVCVVTSSYLNFYCKKEKKFLPGEVKVKVLPPFQTRGMVADSVNHLTKYFHDLMQKEFDLLNKEMNIDAKYYAKKDDTLDNSELLSSKLDESTTSNGNLNNKTVNSEGEDENNKEANNKSLLNDDNNNSINDDDIKKP